MRDVDDSADCAGEAEDTGDTPEEGVRTGCSVRSVVAGVRPSMDTGGDVRVGLPLLVAFGTDGGDGDGEDSGDRMDVRLSVRSGMDRGIV